MSVERERGSASDCKSARESASESEARSTRATIARGEVAAERVLVVRTGHGANCSSVGSVIDTLFLSAAVGGAVFAAVCAAMNSEPITVVGRSKADADATPDATPDADARGNSDANRGAR